MSEAFLISEFKADRLAMYFFEDGRQSVRTQNAWEYDNSIANFASNEMKNLALVIIGAD